MKKYDHAAFNQYIQEQLEPSMVLPRNARPKPRESTLQSVWDIMDNLTEADRKVWRELDQRGQ